VAYLEVEKGRGTHPPLLKSKCHSSLVNVTIFYLFFSQEFFGTSKRGADPIKRAVLNRLLFCRRLPDISADPKTSELQWIRWRCRLPLTGGSRRRRTGVDRGPAGRRGETCPDAAQSTWWRRECPVTADRRRNRCWPVCRRDRAAPRVSWETLRSRSSTLLYNSRYLLAKTVDVLLFTLLVERNRP